MIRFVSISILGVLLLSPASAFAQEERTVGLSMGFPASIAIQWDVTERVAVRPEFTFSTTSTEAGDRESTNDGYSLGASVLFFLLQRDALSTYIAPGYTYGRAEAESSTTVDSTSRTHQVTGSFGVQYRLGDRVRVFGETGLSFSSNKNEADDIFNSSTTSDRLGNRGAVGLVFYF